jgi:5'-3' exonuclease
MEATLLDSPAQPIGVETNDELLLIDLSSIAHPVWHQCSTDPNPDACSIQTVDRVRQLAQRFPTAAICCDSGKSFRKELDPTYKAQRPAQEAPLKHQIRLATEKLKADGFPVWCIDGFEADDVIATAVTKALAIEGTRVLIATADKDLLQLVSDRVHAKSVRDGAIIDADAVKAKFGVTPAQMGDYLCLVGDASDNVKGAKGIGEKRAADLLNTWGTLDALYADIDRNGCALTAGLLNSLKEFRDRLPTVRQLIALRTDVDIPFEEIAAERTPKDIAPIAEEASDMEAGFESAAPIATVANVAGQPSIPNGADSGRASVDAVTAGSTVPRAPQTDAAASVPNVGGSGHPGNGNGQAMVHTPDVLAPAPEDWSKQLEPRSQREARELATAMYQARLFNGYGSPPAVLSTIMAGRELGLQAIASLRGFHIVEGRHALAADLIRGLVMRSGLADFFKCTERTPDRATFKTHRKDDPDPDPTILTYTIEDGRTAFGFRPDLTEKERGDKDRAWKASGWGRNPADMCVARCGAKLARLVYPEVVFGLYAPEELE